MRIVKPVLQLNLPREFFAAIAGCILFAATAFLSAPTALHGANTPIELRIDFSRTNGLLRPLHGINKGPLAAGGLIVAVA